MKKIKGKIGFCDNATLGIKDLNGNPLNGGHYVYIREINGNKCNVNVITSLEYANGNYNAKKLRKVRDGKIYAIPKSDANFSRWSAINLDGNIKNVNISKIKNIGSKKIKRRHKFFVGKFTKK
ncbi:unknown [Acidiphilium sp. CAG:727]|jgi:hypothetical protein|nr:unknown [Acidiphilium sp. CAG:727]